MKSGNSVQKVAAVGALALAGLGWGATASAENVFWSVGLGSPGVQVAVSNAPQVMYQPRAYYQPQVVYQQEYPVVVQRAPVYSAYPVYSRPVVVQPPVVLTGWPGQHRGWHHGWGHGYNGRDHQGGYAQRGYGGQEHHDGHGGAQSPVPQQPAPQHGQGGRYR